MGEVVCTLIVDEHQTDLVLPDNVPIHLVTRSICEALKIQLKETQRVELYCIGDEEDHLIHGSKTLAQAKIVNGSYLRLIPQIIMTNDLAYLLGPKNLMFHLYAKNRIGRSSHAVGQDIDLTKLDQNSIVSRNHAEIFFENGRYWIKDLGSKNGTFLNGQKILSRPVALRTNDVLHFGSAKRGVKLIFTCK